MRHVCCYIIVRVLVRADFGFGILVIDRRGGLSNVGGNGDGRDGGDAGLDRERGSNGLVLDSESMLAGRFRGDKMDHGTYLCGGQGAAHSCYVELG